MHENVDKAPALQAKQHSRCLVASMSTQQHSSPAAEAGLWPRTGISRHTNEERQSLLAG